MEVQPLTLSHPQPSGRIIKRGALAVFRTVRVLAEKAHKVPGALVQAGQDVREAWQESAHPNA
ncbi:MAG: hypothetical protein HS110_10420 [Zoogloeaceae bacterium]|nr:hypothetical protein [Zoogloeaceae bacterium]MCK6385520.1 hypothetical protein [Rhodocyclaceae bacterium]